MAERRMFHIQIVGSEAFLSMPPTAQLLYFHLGMRADEDGFVDNALPTVRAVGLRPKDLRVLLERRFLLQVDGLLVIKHWKLANTSKMDRMRELRYPEEAEKIYIRASGSYTDHPVDDGQSLAAYKRECMVKKAAALARRKAVVSKGKTSAESEDFGRPSGSDSEDIVLRSGSDSEPSIAEHSKAELSIAEHSLAEHSLAKHSSTAADAAVEAPPGAAAAAAAREMRLLHGELGKGVVLLTDEQMEDLLNRMGLEAFDQYVDKLASFILRNGAKVRNHYGTILRWWQEDGKVV